MDRVADRVTARVTALSPPTMTPHEGDHQTGRSWCGEDPSKGDTVEPRPADTPGWVRQDVSKFTVEVCDIRREPRTVGTGFLASPDAKVVTSAKVVLAALGHAEGDQPGETLFDGQSLVGVRLPPKTALDALRDRGWKLYRAEILTIVDDVVLIKIVDPPQLRAEQIAVLGGAAGSSRNRFASLVYGRPGHFRGFSPSGVIGEPVADPPDAGHRTRILTLESADLASDMAGAPVHDQKRDLVVAITTDPVRGPSGSPDKNSAVSYGVDAECLEMSSFQLQVNDFFEPRKGPEPSSLLVAELPRPQQNATGLRIDGERASLGFWAAEHELLPWAGRAELLAELTGDFSDSRTRVMSLIGLGGEGKTATARRATINLLSDRSAAPAGVFWWSFYDRPSGDEFLDEALQFVFGDDLPDGQRSQSPSAKAASLVARLKDESRLLFVLDGMERLQMTEGASYGMIGHSGVRDFVQLFAAPTHSSNCLVTSRVPLQDVKAYTTHSGRVVTGLSKRAGRTLLRHLGVKSGSDRMLEEFSESIDGHALTLTLSAAHVAHHHNGDAAALGRLGLAGGVAREEGARRVLRSYDGYLSDEQRRALAAGSVHRISVPAEALGLSAQDAERLATLRLLQPAGAEDVRYSLHPIVRGYYLDGLIHRGLTSVNQAHRNAMSFYVRRAERRTDRQLSDLEPSLEAFHHACMLSDFDAAYDLYRDIDRPRGTVSGDTGRVLTYRFGAYEKNLGLVRRFFPDGNVAEQPFIPDPAAAAYLINEAGLCLMSLGQLAEAVGPFRRAAKISRRAGDVEAENKTLFNLVELHTHLGELAQARDLADEALELIAGRDHAPRLWRGLAYRAWVDHLRGDLDAASAGFAEAETVQLRADPRIRHLYDLWGAWHAEHLYRTGRERRAADIVNENLRVSTADGYSEAVSQCYRGLGDLAVVAGRPDIASGHYDTALRIAEQITHTQVLIEALLARGGHYIRLEDQNRAFDDLQRALELAEEGQYNIFVADLKIQLALLCDQLEHGGDARKFGRAALDASIDMRYHWGATAAARWGLLT